jgi:hypothetical protein
MIAKSAIALIDVNDSDKSNKKQDGENERPYGHHFPKKLVPTFKLHAYEEIHDDNHSAKDSHADHGREIPDRCDPNHIVKMKDEGACPNSGKGKICPKRTPENEKKRQ